VSVFVSVSAFQYPCLYRCPCPCPCSCPCPGPCPCSSASARDKFGKLAHCSQKISRECQLKQLQYHNAKLSYAAVEMANKENMKIISSGTAIFRNIPTVKHSLETLTIADIQCYTQLKQPPFIAGEM
jgi:hypothetical protein